MTAGADHMGKSDQNELVVVVMVGMVMVMVMVMVMFMMHSLPEALSTFPRVASTAP